MQWLGIVIFVILSLFVAWLVIDTIIYVVKKVKDKKRAKRGGMRLGNDEVIDNDTTEE